MYKIGQIPKPVITQKIGLSKLNVVIMFINLGLLIRLTFKIIYIQ